VLEYCIEFMHLENYPIDYEFSLKDPWVVDKTVKVTRDDPEAVERAALKYRRRFTSLRMYNVKKRELAFETCLANVIEDESKRIFLVPNREGQGSVRTLKREAALWNQSKIREENYLVNQHNTRIIWIICPLN
jgi:hypothetical protein